MQTKQEIEKKEKIIVDGLNSIIRRAQFTQKYFPNDKRTVARLADAYNESLSAEKNLEDIIVLEEINRQLKDCEKIKTRNTQNLFSRRQSSREYVQEILDKSKTEKEHQTDKISKRISGIPLMPRDFYYAVLAKKTNMNFREYESILETKYGRIPTHIKPEEYAKEAIRTIHMYSTRMQVDSSFSPYRVMEKHSLNGDEYRDFRSIVDAGLYVHEKKVKRSLNEKFKKLNEPKYSYKKRDLNKEFEDIIKYEISKYESKIKNMIMQYPQSNHMEKMIPKMTKLLEEYYALSKSTIKYERLIDLAQNNLSPGINAKVVDKLQKESQKLMETSQEVAKEIENLKRETEEMITKLQENNRQQHHSTEEKQKEKKESKPQTIKSDSKSSRETEKSSQEISNAEELKKLKAEKEKLKAEREKLLSSKNVQYEQLNNNTNTNDNNSPANIDSEEQHIMYEKYKNIRSTLDRLFDNKSQYSSEEYFRGAVVNALHQYGSTYDEIMKNVKDIREELDVTKMIKQEIAEVRLTFDNVDQMNEEQENGLTKFENVFIGKLVGKSLDSEISPDLKSEINYYIERHRKLESDTEFLVQNKNAYPKDAYREVLEDLKTQNYVNTVILDEIGLSSKVYKSR